MLKFINANIAKIENIIQFSRVVISPLQDGVGVVCGILATGVKTVGAGVTIGAKVGAGVATVGALGAKVGEGVAIVGTGVGAIVGA